MVKNEVKARILITGAAGLVGRAVIEHFVGKNGYTVRAHVRNSVHARALVGQAIDLTKIELIEADFARVGDSTLLNLTKDCDVIIHAAGVAHRPEASYEEYELVNVRATQHLAEAAAINNVRAFVFLSTSAVYGPGPFDHISESGPLKANTPYAVSKLKAETWLESFQGIPKIIVLRPSLVFGEGDRGNLLNLIKQIKANRYVHIGASPARKSLIYAKDLAKAISSCMDKLPEGYEVFNVANSDPVSIRTLAEEIARCLDPNSKIASVPEPMIRVAVRVAQMLLQEKSPVTIEQIDKLTTTTTCSTAKLVSQTGFRPSSLLSESLQAEISWAQSNDLI